MKGRPPPPAARIAVAYSGGRDSTALLHATVQAAQPLGVQVLALHVHHGLQPAADDWLAHCRRTCARWAARGLPLSFDAQRLTCRPPPGESIEAWARRERYRALREMALRHGATAVLLAHHRRDQAETLLLQALRGAGIAGLAGMPREAERAGLRWLRPWLDHDVAAIEAYLRRHRLRHVEDPSNAEARYARSRLRTEVWPALTAAFPQADASLATAAQWAAQAREVCDERAREDLATLVGPRGLVLSAWRGLTPARRSLALRHWLQGLGLAAPASLVTRLLDEADAPGAASWPVPGGGRLLRHRGLLRLDALPGADGLRTAAETQHTVEGHTGWLRVRPVAEGGLALDRLARLRPRPRGGGERFALGPGRPSRSLKQQFQSREVPAAKRDGPLLYDGEQLVFVAGLGIEAQAQAPAGVPQVALEWVPGGASGPAATGRRKAPG